MPEHTCPVCGTPRAFAEMAAGTVYVCECGEPNRLPSLAANIPVRRRPPQRSVPRPVSVGAACCLVAVLSWHIASQDLRLPRDFFRSRDTELTRTVRVAAEEAAALKRLSGAMRGLARKQLLIRVELDRLRHREGQPSPGAVGPKTRAERAERQEELVKEIDRLEDEHAEAVETYLRCRRAFYERLREWERRYPGQFLGYERDLDDAL